MSLGMQQGTVPVGSVAQTLPMAGMPQTISMVQQIHPVSMVMVITAANTCCVALHESFMTFYNLECTYYVHSCRFLTNIS